MSRDIKFLNVLNNCSSFEDFYEPHVPIKNVNKRAEARDAHDVFIDGPCRVDLSNNNTAARGDASTADSSESPSRALERPSRTRSDSQDLRSWDSNVERDAPLRTTMNPFTDDNGWPEDNTGAHGRDRETTSESPYRDRETTSESPYRKNSH